MASRFISPTFDAGSGVKPPDGAKLSFFATGTSTPKDTFTTAAATVANANPVIADANGVFPDIFIDGAYKVTLTDKNNVQVGFGEADPVSSSDTLNDGRYMGAMTLAEAVAIKSPVLGMTITITNRANGLFTIVTGETPNTFDIVTMTTSGFQLQLDSSAELNLKQFGAVGDWNGSTGADDTAVFKRVRDLIKTLTNTDITSLNPLGGPKIIIPFGGYKITEANAMMDGVGTTRVQGLTFEGDPGTRINYISPAIAVAASQENSLLYFNDSFLFVNFNNIRFELTNVNDDLWFSTSNGGTQDVKFDRCTFDGTCNKWVRIGGGTNVNSEFQFTHGTVTGEHDIFLDVVASDQNLNYWFDHFKYWAKKGTWVRATKGGHIKILPTCDMSGHEPTVETFIFELLGNTHAQGVTSFIADGLRLEHKTDFSKLLRCEWPSGIVSFKDIDQSSQSGSYTSTIVNCLVALNNVDGPNIDFSGAQLIGKHEYIYTSNQFERLNQIKYDGIVHSQINDPNDFLTITNSDANPNDGGIPNIVFSGNCRGPDSYVVAGNKRFVWDRELGSITRASISTRDHVVSLKTTEGGLPRASGSSQNIVLPKDVYITKIDFFSANGSVSEFDTYDFRLLDGNGTTHHTESGTPFATGFRTIVDVNLFVTTLLDRTIHVQDFDPVVQNSKASWVRVHYNG